ncbi:unnamed protein product [Cyprideis torosa]|uniref:alpha-mannosidase n=1 Tax=Cyprideis torosa TaxID=163714 RepID=A0A7R8WA09_9CRUS|nr:unnamed protein product [Cyprideis torosa]CAG0884875.1 unnamed protein product [Cyprideis torosa]
MMAIGTVAPSAAAVPTPVTPSTAAEGNSGTSVMSTDSISAADGQMDDGFQISKAQKKRQLKFMRKILLLRNCKSCSRRDGDEEMNSGDGRDNPEQWYGSLQTGKSQTAGATSSSSSSSQSVDETVAWTASSCFHREITPCVTTLKPQSVALLCWDGSWMVRAEVRPTSTRPTTSPSLGPTVRPPTTEPEVRVREPVFVSFVFGRVDLTGGFCVLEALIFTVIVDGSPVQWGAKNATCGYDACPLTNPAALNVHIVSHSHDDLGWLKTVDQYYWGLRNDIQRVGVQYIFDSVINSLLKNPSRRFIQVESGFFYLWWREQTDDMKQTVRNLVNTGRLEFINGGWVMNDEATAHYSAIIDHMSWGIAYLNEEFGSCSRPHVAWQIDPFGHSREHSSILAEMGFDGMFFARLDYRDKRRRVLSQEMEMIWRGSEILGSGTDLFTGVLYNHYSPPPGFCFDYLCYDQIVDDVRSPEYNVPQKVSAFINYTKGQAEKYLTNNVMLTMGNDFNYQFAESWFKNLDKLIKYVNEGSETHGVNVFYSTPSCYLKSVNEGSPDLRMKVDDFFPYASDPHAFWTGYFSSRPTFKRMIRDGEVVLQACKQLLSVQRRWSDQEDMQRLNDLRNFIGIMQHHDAVTGTAKQHVTDDYYRMIHLGIEQAIKVVAKTLGSENWSYCALLNISQCEITEYSAAFDVAVYNPGSQATDFPVRLPIYADPAGNDPLYEVKDSEGNIVQSEVFLLPFSVHNIPGRTSRALHQLVFLANIPGLSSRTFSVRNIAADSVGAIVKKWISYKVVDEAEENMIVKRYDDVLGSKLEMRDSVQSKKGKEFPVPPHESRIFTNGLINFTLDGGSGLLSSIEVEGIKLNVKQELMYYIGHPGNNSEFEFRASGAYIFRPLQQSPSPITMSPVSLVYVEGDLVQEVHQVFDSWATQVLRIYKGRKDLEIEWQVGPIPVEDGFGREIVSKITTDIASQGEFITGTNGREEGILRKRDFRNDYSLEENYEPASQNYYPVTSSVSIEDESARLSVLVDRAQGVSSLADGELELMVHRRLLDDDAFGVDEPLDETAFGVGLVARGRHRLFLTAPNDLGTKAVRLAEKTEFYQPLLMFSNETKLRRPAPKLDLLSEALPEGVNLLTMEPWANETILIRLEHFLRSPSSVSVDLKALLQNVLDIQTLTEVTLDGVQPVQSLKDRMKWSDDEDTSSSAVEGTVVTLTPFQIVTVVAHDERNIRQVLLSVELMLSKMLSGSASMQENAAEEGQSSDDVPVVTEAQKEQVVPAEEMDDLTPIAGEIADVAAFSKEALKTVMALVKSSRSLPKAGDEWDFYSSFTGFMAAISAEKVRLLETINTLLRQQGFRSRFTINQDHADQLETLVDANDQIMDRIAVLLDEADTQARKMRKGKAGAKEGDEHGVVVKVQHQHHRRDRFMLQKKTFPVTKFRANHPGNPDTPSAGGGTSAGSSPSHTPSVATPPSTPQREIVTQKINVPTNTTPLAVTVLEKPQVKFKIPVDNSNKKPFKPRLKEKPNAKVPLNNQPEEKDGVEEQVEGLVKELLTCKEIAVDLEHHSYRSFLGLTCLMQITAKGKDYLVDTLALRDSLQSLNQVFTHPAILKIFHGAEWDVNWMQRDLGLYVVGLFDTFYASQTLGFPSNSLAYLLHHYCRIIADKQYQLADWRIRPLPMEMKKYAREDTHYLVYIYHRLKADLLKEGGQEDNLLRSVFSLSKAVALIRYEKPRLGPDSHMEMYRRSRKRFNNRQLFALKELFKWRDATARENDESTGYVLPNHMLLALSENLPREVQGIYALCNPIPPHVHSNAIALHKLILAAREQPLVVEGVSTATGQVETEDDLRRKRIDDVAQKVNMNARLDCPFDSSCVERQGLIVSLLEGSPSSSPRSTAKGSGLESKTLFSRDQSSLAIFRKPAAPKQVASTRPAPAAPPPSLLSPFDRRRVVFSVVAQLRGEDEEGGPKPSLLPPPATAALTVTGASPLSGEEDQVEETTEAMELREHLEALTELPPRKGRGDDGSLEQTADESGLEKVSVSQSEEEEGEIVTGDDEESEESLRRPLKFDDSKDLLLLPELPEEKQKRKFSQGLKTKGRSRGKGRPLPISGVHGVWREIEEAGKFSGGFSSSGSSSPASASFDYSSVDLSGFRKRKSEDGGNSRAFMPESKRARKDVEGIVAVEVAVDTGPAVAAFVTDSETCRLFERDTRMNVASRPPPLQPVGAGGPTQSPSVFLVSCSGEIDSGDFPHTDLVFLKYSYVFGPDWSVVSGLEEGITQNCQKSSDQFSKFVWNFPLDVTFKSTNPYGWPRIVISAFGPHFSGMEVACGYGGALIPVQPGCHRIKIPMFLPESASPIQRFTAWITGRQPEFVDPRIVASGEGRDVTRVRSLGSLTLRLNIVHKDFTKCGYVCSPQAAMVNSGRHLSTSSSHLRGPEPNTAPTDMYSLPQVPPASSITPRLPAILGRGNGERRRSSIGSGNRQAPSSARTTVVSPPGKDRSLVQEIGEVDEDDEE